MSLVTLLSYFLYLALCALRRLQSPASKSFTASTPNKRSGRRDGMSLGDALGGDQAQQGNQGEKSQHGRGIAWQGNCCGSSGSGRRHGRGAGKQEQGCSGGRRDGSTQALDACAWPQSLCCHDGMEGKEGK